MKRRVAPAIVVILACRAPVSKREPVTTASATASAAPAATANQLPDPVTTYKSLEDARLDGRKAFGKSLLMRAWRGTSDDRKVTLHACNAGTGTMRDLVIVTYPAELRPLVRKIRNSPPPGEACHAASDGCARVVVHIRGFADSTDALAGDLESVLDVAP